MSLCNCSTKHRRRIGSVVHSSLLQWLYFGAWVDPILLVGIDVWWPLRKRDKLNSPVKPESFLALGVNIKGGGYARQGECLSRVV